MKEIELSPVFTILNKNSRSLKIKLPQPGNVYPMMKFQLKILEKNGKNFRI